MVRFFFASLAGLIPGVIRREPVSLLVGVALSIVTVFTLAASIVRLHTRAGHRIAIEGLSRTVSAGTPFALSIGGADRLSGVAVATLHAGTRSVSAPAELWSAAERVTIPIARLPRGLYDVCRIRVDLPGVFRLVRARLAAVLEQVELVRAVPLAADTTSRAPAILRGGTAGVVLRSSERNDELVEQRPYHPGDDPRRLEWRLFAHTGELFVRIGEEVPPPTRAATVVIDCTRRRYTHGELDRLIAHALGLIFGLERDGVMVRCAVDVGDGAQSIGRPQTAAWTLAAVDAERGLHPAALAGVERGATVLHDAAQVRVTSGRSPWVPVGARCDGIVVLVDGDVRVRAALD